MSQQESLECSTLIQCENPTVFSFYVVTCQLILKKFGQKAVNTPQMITSRYNITLKGVSS